MPSLTDMYAWAVEHCDGTVPSGYDQSHREQELINGVYYYDCSSFVYYALIAGGWDPETYSPYHKPFTTLSMIDVLTALGWKEASPSGTHRAGDIGWNNDHTEICYEGGNGSGRYMGAANSTSGCRISSTTRTWTKLFRYTGDEVHYVKSPSIAVISAIGGNFAHESYFNPGAWESLTVRSWDSLYSNNTGGYGLGQWTNTSSSSMRLLNLYNWMTSNGYAMTDGDAQVAYVKAENYWAAKGSYASLDDFYASTDTDIDELTRQWMLCWEGIDYALSARQEWAHIFYEYLPSHKDDSVSWISGNFALDSSQRCNNCVCLYQALRGTLPEDSTAPDPAEPDDGLTIWDITRKDPGYNAGSYDVITTDFTSMFYAGQGGNGKRRKLHIRKSRRR